MPVSNNKFSLANRCYVVTGASSGIGRAMAGHLAQAGADVILVARRESELQRAVDEINTENERARYVVADLGQREQLAQIAARCKSVAQDTNID